MPSAPAARPLTTDFDRTPMMVKVQTISTKVSGKEKLAASTASGGAKISSDKPDRMPPIVDAETEMPSARTPSPFLVIS